MDLSVINYYGHQDSRCGYCKGKKSSMAHGMHAYTMTPEDYQALIDRGWRRSGMYCYKPHNPTTCCPSYTIRCDALDFKLSKSHKKILKRMTRFLRDGKKEKNEAEDEGDNNRSMEKQQTGDNDNDVDIQDEKRAPDIPLPQVDLAAVTAANPERNAKAKQHNEEYESNLNALLKKDKDNEMPLDGSAHSSVKSCESLTPKPPCKKAKQMRLERRQAKLLAKGLPASTVKTTPSQSEKSLSEFIADASPTDKHKLKIVLVPSRSLKVDKDTFALYQKYQFGIHNDTPDRVTPSGLERFLFKTPLKYHKPTDGPPEGYGSFHQQYWLDDKLIAVAVIDILPFCLSSVYFFYDPDYSFLSLGTYASLREIEFVQQLAKLSPALKYYYMGYYIHSCPKMRYKGKLVPSHLLCPETYVWQKLTDEIIQKLNADKYQRLNPDLSAKDVDEFKPNDLDDVPLLVGKNICTTYGEYIKITGNDDDRYSILEYGKLVGKSCAHRIVYVNA